MLKTICSVLFLLVLTLAGISANAKEKKVIMIIGGTKIYSDEFLHMYRKNNLSLPDSLQKTAQQYLQLFIDFKLKVREAEALGLDTLTSFKNEFTRYRKESASPYLTDSIFDKQLVRTMYNRIKNEVKVSHILIRIPSDASPSDTLKAWNKINKLRQRALNGEDFSQLAAHYSEDPSAKRNRGELGYFSGFMMVYPFENAAYKTPVGQVSPIIRTRFGYHLLKVEDKRPSPGKMHAAHIMFFVRHGSGPEEDAKMHERADSVYQLLQSGANFAQLAQKLSQDKRSSVHGGALPWFRDGQMIPEIAKAAFALKNNGDYSHPIRSQYGWHIVKRLAVKPIPSFAELRPKIIENLKKSPERSQLAQTAFVNKLKSEYAFAENPATAIWLDSLTEQERNSLLAKAKLTGNKILFSINQSPFTRSQFISFILRKNHSGKLLSKSETTRLYKQFVNQSFLHYQDSQLEHQYPKFRLLMKEYHDGLLLFDVTNRKVWQRAVKDTVGLMQYFSHHRENYRTPHYFDGTVYICPSKAIMDSIKRQIQENVDSSAIIAKFGYLKDMSIRTGKFKSGDNLAVDFYIFHEDAKTGKCPAFVALQGKNIPSRLESLNEVKGMCLADYQDDLEKQWVAKLRKKYPVKLKNRAIKQILKHTAKK